MTWDDTGFLLSTIRYNENSIIAEIFTKNHGKVSGIIFGGTSKKIKNYLQVGNQLYLNYNSKSENRIGYFKVEIQHAFSPFYFDNPQKLSCITLAMNLIKLLTAEFQSNQKIYNLINEFYSIIANEYWLKEYIFWELKFLKTIGYDLVLEDIVKKKVIGEEVFYTVESSTDKKVVPSFLMNKNEHDVDFKTLLNGLKLVSDFLDKTILKPNNLNYPISRVYFLNSLK